MYKEEDLAKLERETRGFGDRLKKIEAASMTAKAEKPQPVEIKTTATGLTVGSATSGVLSIQRILPLVAVAGPRAAHVRDLLRIVKTEMLSCDHVRVTAINGASPQTEGFAKEETDYSSMATSSSPTRTIATYIKVSRQLWHDLVGLQQFLATDAVERIRQIEDWELLFGDNTEPHLNGLCTQASAYSGVYAGLSDSPLDTLLHAALEAEIGSGTPPDAFVLNPRDLHDCLLARDSGGTSFLAGDPATVGADVRLFGRRVLSIPDMPYGKFLCGAFNSCAFLAENEAATLMLAESHAEDFIANRYTTRIEERVAVCCTRPAAFVYGSF
jgi:HK97 family phage major capsid protein